MKQTEYMKFCADFQLVVSELLNEKRVIDNGYGTKLARTFVRVWRRDLENAIDSKSSLQKGEFINQALKMGFIRESEKGSYIFIASGQQVCYISRGVFEVISRGVGVIEC